MLAQSVGLPPLTSAFTESPVPGFGPGPIPVIMGIWGVNQQTGTRFPSCPAVFQLILKLN